MIRTITPDEMETIAFCHMQAFPDSITTKLGKQAVIGMLHWYLQGTNKIFLSIRIHNKIVGYVGGHIRDGSEDSGSASGMTQSGFNSLILSVLKKPWLLLHPEVRQRYPFIVKNILKRIGIRNNQLVEKRSDQDTQRSAGLVVIVVLPEFQKQGIGTQLMSAFELEAKTKAAEWITLSVRKTNSGAIQSYKRNGYEIIEDHGISYVMRKYIRST